MRLSDRLLALVVGAMLSACAGDAPSSDVTLQDYGPADAGRPDQGVLPDLGGCATMCWRGFKCVSVGDGPEVRASIGRDPGRACDPIDVLCSSREVVAACAEGCASTGATTVYQLAGFSDWPATLADADARRLCEDWRPRTLNDPCSADDDCRDTLPHREGTGPWTLRYLSCESGRCATADPPELGDHGADCGDSPPVDAGDRGVYESAGCSSGQCAFFGEPSAPSYHGCTSACDYDSDCPTEHRCVRWGADGGARTVGPGHCLPGLSPDEFGAWYRE